MSICVTYPRLGLMVARTVLKYLDSPANQVTYRKFIKEYQSQVPDQLWFKLGRSKLDDNFPNISMEIESEDEEFVATSYTKEFTFDFFITVNLKVGTGKSIVDGREVNELDAYLITMAEFTKEILNEPLVGLQFMITANQEGQELAVPLKIFHSQATHIDYGELYNGALRTAKITWQAKIMRVGPSGGQQGY